MVLKSIGTNPHPSHLEQVRGHLNDSTIMVGPRQEMVNFLNSQAPLLGCHSLLQIKGYMLVFYKI